MRARKKGWGNGEERVDDWWGEGNASGGGLGVRWGP